MTIFDLKSGDILRHKRVKDITAKVGYVNDLGEFITVDLFKDEKFSGSYFISQQEFENEWELI